jgi:hypothetical protein
MIVDKRAEARSDDLQVMTAAGSARLRPPNIAALQRGFRPSRASRARQSAFIRRYRSSVRVISYDHRGHGSGSATHDRSALLGAMVCEELQLRRSPGSVGTGGNTECGKRLQKSAR